MCCVASVAMPIVVRGKGLMTDCNLTSESLGNVVGISKVFFEDTRGSNKATNHG
jgi:hypothetical protein